MWFFSGLTASCCGNWWRAASVRIPKSTTGTSSSTSCLEGECHNRPTAPTRCTSHPTLYNVGYYSLIKDYVVYTQVQCRNCSLSTIGTMPVWSRKSWMFYKDVLVCIHSKMCTNNFFVGSQIPSRKRIFGAGVFTDPGTCLVAAMSFFPERSPDPWSGFEGPLRGRVERGREGMRKGKEGR